MESVGSKWCLQLLCMLLVALTCAQAGYHKETHGHPYSSSLSEIDNECWETSSRKLVEVKKLRMADTVGGLWDFMIYLKESTNPKHNTLFDGLAQHFWDIYVDCVLSRSHGLGRRQLFPSKYYFTYLPKISSGLEFTKQL